MHQVGITVKNNPGSNCDIDNVLFHTYAHFSFVCSVEIFIISDRFFASGFLRDVLIN